MQKHAYLSLLLDFLPKGIILVAVKLSKNPQNWQNMIEKSKIFRANDFFTHGFPFAITHAVHTAEELQKVQRFTREFWKITCIIKGNGRVFIEDLPFPLREGSILLVHPAAKTNFDILSSELEIDNILFDLSFLGNELDSLRYSFRFFDIFSDSFNQKSCFSFYLQNSNTKIVSLIRDMKREYKFKQTNYAILLKAKLLELLILLQRGSEKMAFNTSQEQIADYLTFYLEKNYKTDISINLLADKVNLTPNHLCSLYKKIMGKSIITALNEIRLKHAAKMLTENDSNVSEIALECGFNDLSYFYRSFKKTYGETPGKFSKKIG